MNYESTSYKILSKVLRIVGKIELHEWPLPFIKKVRGFLGGAEQRAVLRLLRPGDVMLGRFTHHLTSVLIPGDWDHAAIYIGNGKVVHITGEGVAEQDTLEFMDRDEIAVLRIKSYDREVPTDVLRKEIVGEAKLILSLSKRSGYKYDFKADFGDNTRLSCSELVRMAVGGAFKGLGMKPSIDLTLKPVKFLGITLKMAFTPDDIFNSGLRRMHVSKTWRKAQKEKAKELACTLPEPEEG